MHARLGTFFPQMESMSDIQVVFADNHPLILSGLRSAVADHSDISIVAECLDRERALNAVRNHFPDVLLLSAELLQGNQDALQQLVADMQETHVILLTSRHDPEFLGEALRSGARGVFQCNKPVHFIPQAIRKVTNGGLWFERAHAEHVLDRLVSRRNETQDPEDHKIAAVTAREREVIGLICKGLKNREISEQLHISEVTVSHHLTSIFRKLEVSDRISLILYSVRNRVVLL
jgi:two-component system, NarL family, nitrate/nitrite response regulator NarL